MPRKLDRMVRHMIASGLSRSQAWATVKKRGYGKQRGKHVVAGPKLKHSKRRR